MDATKTAAYLREQAADILDRCTACGTCVEVCPTLPHLSLAEDPATIAAGILGLLRDDDPAEAAARFVDACSGSGICRDKCPEAIDPYTLMRLAKRQKDTRAGKKPPKSDYHLIDLSLRAQVGAQEPTWFTRRPPEDARADLVFYMGCNIMGCNIMRTPHIALDVMSILDALELEYATVGGGANCCGIKQFRVGLEAAETVSRNTLSNFASLRPREVVSWCPTCEIHFSDFGANHLDRDFPLHHLSRLLVEHLDRLTPRLRPLPQRVVVEEHARLYPGDTIREDLRTVLGAIPGLEVIPTEQHVYGYQCAAVTLPALMQQGLEEVLSEARRVQAETIVSVFHGCHRFLTKAVHDAGEPFEVVNWASLIARSLGVDHPDRYQEYTALGDESLILERALTLDAGKGIPIEKLRQAIRWEFGG